MTGTIMIPMVESVGLICTGVVSIASIDCFELGSSTNSNQRAAGHAGSPVTLARYMPGLHQV